MLYVRIFYAFIYARIITILVVIILILLVGIIWRISNDHRNFAFVLSFYTFGIFGIQPKHIQLFIREIEAQIIQRINKADVLKLLIFTHFLLVGKFYVQVGDVVRQNG